MAKTKNTNTNRGTEEIINNDVIRKNLTSLYDNTIPPQDDVIDNVSEPSANTKPEDNAESENNQTQTAQDNATDTNTSISPDNQVSESKPEDNAESENNQTQTVGNNTDTGITPSEDPDPTEESHTFTKDEALNILGECMASVINRCYEIHKDNPSLKRTYKTMAKINAIKMLCYNANINATDDIIIGFAKDIRRIFGVYESVVFGKEDPDNTIKCLEHECSTRGLSFDVALEYFSLIDSSDIHSIYLIIKGIKPRKAPNVSACTSISTSAYDSKNVTKTPTSTSGANINITYGNVNVTVSNPVATTNTGVVAHNPNNNDTVSIGGIENLEKLRISRSAIDSLTPSDHEFFRHFRLGEW